MRFMLLLVLESFILMVQNTIQRTVSEEREPKRGPRNLIEMWIQWTQKTQSVVSVL